MTELSARELEVLRECADGAPVKEVAARMHLGYSTVKNYLSTAYRKLGVTSLIGAYRVKGWIVMDGEDPLLDKATYVADTARVLLEKSR